ncbi:Txe/YoeB family addiction module toxin [Corynebacterium aquatimens]|uniref:Endoribonuclease YoeB n=1 Tax=Corynebacterium aquatimens TaxID=1190508 RepID=A0A931GVR3_9CORY|nr:Txe/YoeB family addiction module toxin [Corynebacterium aquatimens]MBG6121591.1 toxin YoeB [Corynebacterium aquatimens]WJY65869.1 Toxin YoeB [Corynebacterium aquatimens]
MRVTWDEDAWGEYVELQAVEKRLVKRINQLIRDIQRNGNEGIGKPEPLRFELHGYWSRRIDNTHRLVYRIAGDEIRIASCRYHYEK